MKRDSKIPIYHQIADIIAEEIKNEKLMENDKIKSEREYCENYNVSRATVREALKYLEQNNYVYRIQGKGTFVSPKVFKQNLLKFYSFTEEVKKQGKIPASLIKVFKVIKADKKISENLEIREGDDVYFLERIRLADNIPMMIEKTYLPYSRFPRLNKKDFVDNAMYDVFMNEYNVVFEKAVERFAVLNTEKKMVKLLEMPPNISCIKLERFTYEKNKIIEYTEAVIRGDRFQFEVVLNK